jgi:cold shock CspA family protein
MSENVTTQSMANAKVKLTTPSMVNAKVKFFDPVRGFGFVSLDQGIDAFLHRTVLEKAGFLDLVEGQYLRCEVSEGERSPIVTRILSVASAPSSAMLRLKSATTHMASMQRNQTLTSSKKDPPKIFLTRAGHFQIGTLSSIDEERGFGFVETPIEGTCFLPPPVFSSLPQNAKKAGTSLEVVTLFGERGPIVVAARPAPPVSK